MNRRTRTLIVLAIALVCATGATFGVLHTIRQIPPPAAPEEQVPVVVASRDVAMGMRLTKEDVTVVQWPKKTAPKGMYSDTKKVIDRGLIAGVLENEPLTDFKMARVEEGAGLVPQIRPGMRAISVKVNEVIGVAGFVVPGARVDLVVTIRQQHHSISRVVVSDAQVLTAGARLDQQQAKDGKPIPTTVVTLMVTPEDGERIALAAAEGQLLLTLRNPLDKGKTLTAGITTPVLLGSPVRVERPTPPSSTTGTSQRTVKETPPKPPDVPAYEVVQIRAGKASKEVLK